MTWTSKRGKWDWRKYLTDEERAVIKASDELTAVIKKMRATHSTRYGRERTAIVNRAVQRAKHAALGDVARETFSEASA